MTGNIHIPNVMGVITIGNRNPKDWVDLDLTTAGHWPEPCEIVGVKKYLRKKGLEVRHMPFDIGENIQVTVRRKDISTVSKILSHKKLKDFC